MFNIFKKKIIQEALQEIKEKPKEYYELQCKCTNCGYVDEYTLEKGYPSWMGKCKKCGCNGLIKNNHE